MSARCSAALRSSMALRGDTARNSASACTTSIGAMPSFTRSSIRTAYLPEGSSAQARQVEGVPTAGSNGDADVGRKYSAGAKQQANGRFASFVAGEKERHACRLVHFSHRQPTETRPGPAGCGWAVGVVAFIDSFIRSFVDREDRDARKQHQGIPGNKEIQCVEIQRLAHAPAPVPASILVCFWWLLRLF